MIAEPLLPLAVDIGSVQTYPGNPRRGDVGAIANSLDAFGQLKPIVVQASTGYIIAGNHTTLAARQLGWTQIAAVRVDVDDATARRFLVADNRIPYLASNDSRDLAALIAEISADGDFYGTGYDADDVRDALKALEDLTTDEEDEPSGGGGGGGVCECCGK